MRLLVVSSWFPYPPDNGSRVRAMALLRELSSRHAISLLAPQEPDRAADPGPLGGMCQRVEAVSVPTVDPERLGARGLLSPTPRYLVQRHSPEMARRVAELVESHDAALGLAIDAARYLAPHRRLARVFEEAEVAVLRERGPETRSLRARARRQLTWWKHARYVRGLVNAMDRTTVVSEPERAHLVGIGCDPSRLAVVPNGVEVPAAPPPPLAGRAPRLVYAGSVRYFANLDAVRFFAKEILPIVRQRRPDVSFWVTGSADGVDVSGLARAGVQFTGVVPDIDRVVADSAVCVVPLRIGGGTRLKVLQAMAVGTPVVSTAKGAEGLDVEPGEHFLQGDTPTHFAHQVIQLLAEPRFYERQVAAARARVAAIYDWHRIAVTLDRVIEEAAAAARKAGGPAGANARTFRE